MRHRPLEDREYPDPDDGDEDDLDTLPCPECGKHFYEELEQCPHCGQYVTHSTSALAGKSWWYVALALLGVLAVIWLSLGVDF